MWINQLILAQFGLKADIGDLVLLASNRQCGPSWAALPITRIHGDWHLPVSRFLAVVDQKADSDKWEGDQVGQADEGRYKKERDASYDLRQTLASHGCCSRGRPLGR